VPPAAYARALRELGYRLSFGPHAQTDPAVQRFFADTER
jgi:hypothetical protein